MAELTDEELLELAAGATAVDQEVQDLVREVYRCLLEERALIRYYLWKMSLVGPLWLFPKLLGFVAREARLAELAGATAGTRQAQCAGN